MAAAPIGGEKLQTAVAVGIERHRKADIRGGVRLSGVVVAMEGSPLKLGFLWRGPYLPQLAVAKHPGFQRRGRIELHAR